MPMHATWKAGITLGALIALAGCGNSNGSLGSLGSNLFGSNETVVVAAEQGPANATEGKPPPVRVLEPQGQSGFGLFTRTKAPSDATPVNPILWRAALDVLAFLPVTTADETTGVIVTGYAPPPGGGRAYRATVLVQGDALDARALHLSLATRSGPAPAKTIRAVEDAIFTRARQLRIAEIRQ